MADIEVIRNLYGTRFYRIWTNMKTRCYNDKVRSYSSYGARGIKVCDKCQTFGGFFDDMYPSYLEAGADATIDRIDNEKDYSKDNCRWASMKQQCNNRRSNRYITHDGVTKTLMEWSEETGLNRRTIAQRIDNGWGISRALTEEPHFG